MAFEATSATLDDGIRLVTEPMPSVRSVALGMWVRTGSRDEAPAQAGLSHFLEHLLFKGTERFSALEISALWDGLGASVNAATSKETTHIHARLLDEHLDRAVDVMAEMLLEPTYPDIDSERQVVIEEISMYEDEPQDKVHDVLGEAIFGDHPLGRPIIGTADVVGSVPVPEISAYHHARYAGDTIVVSAAGNLDHDHVAELVSRHVRPARTAAEQPAGTETPATATERLCFREKETEQYHLCIGAPGLARDDDRRFVLAVLDGMFGGSSSSRLFTEIREKRGLAYAVGSYVEQFADTGAVALYVGTRGANLAEAGEILGREIRGLTEPAGSEEIDRVKESVKGRLVLASESSAARMARNARATLFGLPLLTLDEMIDRIDAVTAEQVAELAAELWAPERLSAACVGPDREPVAAGLVPVSEALAA